MTEGLGDAPVSWFRRPRRRFWHAVPSTRLVASLWLMPYIVAAVSWGLFGDHGDLPGARVRWASTAVALVEAIWLVLWLRRPVRRG